MVVTLRLHKDTHLGLNWFVGKVGQFAKHGPPRCTVHRPAFATDKNRVVCIALYRKRKFKTKGIYLKAISTHFQQFKLANVTLFRRYTQ